MIKQLFTILICMTAFGSHAFAQDSADHSQHETMQHDAHEHDDDAHEHDDHDHDTDHDDHTDHSAHDHSEHDMDHSAHDHSKHEMDHSDHDHSGMTHGDGHMMDAPGDHSMLHGEDDAHAHHHGDHHHHHDGHLMDHEGTHIMGQNFDKLPSSCTSISEEIEITVRGGTKYAKKFPGVTFAFDQQEWRVKPCSRITWHFINEDNIRHQFMMHGLPRYLYNLGMFHLENTGPRKVSGTMIVPAADETYLVHCDISQHMENGMKAQLVVGNGGEDIPSIPGLTPYVINDKYEAEDLPQVPDTDNGKEKDSLTKQVTDFFNDNVPIAGISFVGLLFGLVCAPLFVRMIALRKRKPEEDTV
ncbi:cupredoxin domain-containing protein [Nitrosomonas sp. Nm51]|uniref:cupredoxin domain-containing protein n=1 Tax=Nitrosomonas sp. Nm51 TaxID=133720 RepID=UPI000AAAAF17|nr:cupredoxin domain-containing protein [Nitrosomonas sp. Nm51]